MYYSVGLNFHTTQAHNNNNKKVDENTYGIM